MSFIEDDVEQAAIEWLEELGWTYVHGPVLAPDGDAPERATWSSVILEGRLRDALTRINHYGGGEGERPGVPIELALPLLQEKVEVVRAMFHGFDYTGFFATKASLRLAVLSGGVDHICGLEPGNPDAGKKRYLEAMSALNKAAGICQHHEAARPWRDEIGFFQAVQRNIQKYTVGASGKSSTRPSNRSCRGRQL